MAGRLNATERWARCMIFVVLSVCPQSIRADITPFWHPFHSAIRAAGGWWGGPPGPRGTPRPAAGRGGRGLRAGEGARPTRLRWRPRAESSRYPTITPFGAGGKPLSDRTVLSVLPAVLIGTPVERPGNALVGVSRGGRSVPDLDQPDGCLRCRVRLYAGRRGNFEPFPPYAGAAPPN